jgi:hypothetical protein
MSFYCNYFKKEFNNDQEYSREVKALGHSHQSFADNVLNRKDGLTGEKIQFSGSFENYLLKDFIGRENLLKWLKLQDKEVAKQYLLETLKRYAGVKDLTYFPSHFELRTIEQLVSVKTYVHFWGHDIYKMIEGAGLKIRYSLFSDLKFPKFSISRLIVDTREKKPLKIPASLVQIEVKKLNYGDYSHDEMFSVERKSLSDLVSTLSGGWERFKNEVGRVEEAGGYMVVLVDADINDFLSFSYSKKRYGKASTQFITRRAREICRLFPNHVQFLFSGGRKNSVSLLLNLLTWGGAFCSKLDLQYYKDSGQFKKLLNSKI